jgi:hypothetical protein
MVCTTGTLAANFPAGQFADSDRQPELTGAQVGARFQNA